MNEYYLAIYTLYAISKWSFVKTNLNLYNKASIWLIKVE